MKRWEDMSEEERLEKYGKSFEIREELHNLNKIRANLAVIEKENVEVSTLEYFRSLKNQYEQARAEYIGGKAWRMIKERQRVAEEEAKVNEKQKGAFEKIKKGWRWLGEQNVEKALGSEFLKKRGWKRPRSKVGKFFARMASLRTAGGLGLLGGGAVVGFGSAVGIGALAARRVMGGAGVAFGSYDLMKLAREKQVLNVNEEEVKDMSATELEEKMAEFEARAKFSGERVVHSHDYEALRREYKKLLDNVGEQAGPGSKITPGYLQEIDELLRKKKEEVTKEEKHRKRAAIGLGLFSVGAFSSSSLTQALETQPDLEGVTPEDVKDAIENGPMLTGEQVEEVIETEAAVSPEILEQAENVVVDVPIGEAEDVTEGVVAETGAGEELLTLEERIVAEQDAAAAGKKAAETTTEVKEPLLTTEEIILAEQAAAETSPATETVEAITGTIKEGGSAWAAARDLVESGKITQEQFAEAWSSPASTAELSSGTTVHISELGLTHAGDQFVYISEVEGVPAHFEVIDYADDTFHIGDNQDLADAFEAEGKEVPEWLEETLEVHETEGAVDLGEPTVVDENLGFSGVSELDEFGESPLTPEEIGEPVTEAAEKTLVEAPEGTLSQEEAVKKAAEGALEMSEDTIQTEWGSANFVLDEDGNIADIFMEEDLLPAKRVELVETAADTLLRPDFLEVIEQNLLDLESAPNKIAKAKEAAWQVFKFREILGSLTDVSSAETNFIRGQIKTVIDIQKFTFGAEIFKQLKI